MPNEKVSATISFSDKGHGKPLVLLHGFPLDRTVWSAQLEELSKSCRVIAPDLPGFGLSVCGGSFSIASLADDVHNFLKETGALPCVLAGLSMGGYVAFAFAKKYMADLLGLILMDTRATADTADGRKARDAMIELAKTKGSAAVAGQMLPKMLAPNAPQAMQARITAVMNRCPAQTIQYACAAMRDREDYTSFLPSIFVKTLLIFGQEEQLIPTDVGSFLQKSIPRAQLEMIPSAGHMAPMEQPGPVNAAIERFMHSL